MSVLDEIRRRDPTPELPLWKLILRYFVLLVGALAVSYAASRLLDVLHLDPFGIRELQW
jgi:hypothetical protein